ncbi:MAG: hypothetical protein MZV63_14385 [Marinilabiliales bacterium]|nr:hypothetical protein [Marinilabiliales bacterium]
MEIRGEFLPRASSGNRRRRPRRHHPPPPGFASPADSLQFRDESRIEEHRRVESVAQGDQVVVAGIHREQMPLAIGRRRQRIGTGADEDRAERRAVDRRKETQRAVQREAIHVTIEHGVHQR